MLFRSGRDPEEAHVLSAGDAALAAAAEELLDVRLYVAGIRDRVAVSVQNTAPGRGYARKRPGYAYPRVSHFFELK